MRTKTRKRSAANPSRQDAGLRPDVREAIDRVWPDGIVELFFDVDESYLCEVHPKLSRAFHNIRHARLLREREAEEGPIWWDESDPDEDPPDDSEPSRSYHLFFISPAGEAFTFETEIETFVEPELMEEEFDETDWDEDTAVSRIGGSGSTGWVVAVSLLAPFAVIEIGDVATFEDGTTTGPEIESYAETRDGERISLEELFRKAKGVEAYEVLMSLRAKISAILEKYGIAVLPAEEWRKPAPWLRGGESSLQGLGGTPIRVLDAFFFEEP